MALLRDASGSVIPVGARLLLGRSRLAQLRIDDPRVSAEHAVLAWDGDGWRVRDLGSRNGTTVDGRRLQGHEDVRLAAGQVLSLADGAWSGTFLSTSAPGPCAVSGDRVVEGEGALLGLPSLDRPTLVVEFHPDLQWTIVRPEGPEPVRDGQLVVVDDVAWQLRLPEAIATTTQAGPRGLKLADIALRIDVSPDEERVDVVLRAGVVERALPSRGHLYVLAILARLRKRAAEERVHETEQGWITPAALERLLRTSRNHLHVCFHRIRQDHTAAGVVDAAGVIERRATTGEVRLGVAAERVEVR